MPRALLVTARIAGIAWTMPNTVLGLVAGVVGMAFGAHAHVNAREWAIVFHRWPWGPGGAITLGVQVGTFVMWLWVGGVIMTLGLLLALLPARRRRPVVATAAAPDEARELAEAAT